MKDSFIPVQIRENLKTGRLELFFRNSNGQDTWLECFDGAHSECAEEYRLSCTKPVPVNPLPFGAATLLGWWNSIPGAKHPGRAVLRLPR